MPTMDLPTGSFSQVSIEIVNSPEIEDTTLLSTITEEGLLVEYRIRSDNDVALWSFVQEHQEELRSLIRKAVAEATINLEVLDIQFREGSVLLGILLVASAHWVGTHLGGIAAATTIVGKYPETKKSVKEIIKDLKSVESKVQEKVGGFFHKHEKK